MYFVVHTAASFEEKLEILSNIMLLLWNNGRKDRPEDYPAWQFLVGLLMWHGYVDTTLTSILPPSMHAGFVNSLAFSKHSFCASGGFADVAWLCCCYTGKCFCFSQCRLDFSTSSISKHGYLLVARVVQEYKLGRWWVQKQSKKWNFKYLFVLTKPSRTERGKNTCKCSINKAVAHQQAHHQLLCRVIFWSILSSIVL